MLVLIQSPVWTRPWPAWSTGRCPWDDLQDSNSGRTRTVVKKKIKRRGLGLLFYFPSECLPALTGGSFPLLTLERLDWVSQHLAAALFLIFLNRLPKVAHHSLQTSMNCSLKMSLYVQGRWPNRKLSVLIAVMASTF